MLRPGHLRLVGAEKGRHWDSRGHFFAAAVEAMRRILVDSARRKQRLKHGGFRRASMLKPACFRGPAALGDSIRLPQAAKAWHPAVEAVCKIIAQNDKATLGSALDAVTAKTKLHPKLQEGFKALYGYTSDDHCIRHALKDDGQPEEEDARFLLVSCSAFVNYLAEKARKNDMPLA